MLTSVPVVKISQCFRKARETLSKHICLKLGCDFWVCVCISGVAALGMCKESVHVFVCRCFCQCGCVAGCAWVPVFHCKCLSDCAYVYRLKVGFF